MPAESSTTRLLTVTGAPYERGHQAGAALGTAIRELLACQELADAAADGLSLHQWLPAARRFLPAIERHAPRVLAEMHGWADGAGLPFDDLLLLTCAYERHMAAKVASHCTAFGVLTPAGRVYCGQNNDELPEHWAGARHDLVIRHRHEGELSAAIYTHPGIPAYMGMNSSGLCVTWMYIDNGRRQDGLPTNVLLRELLYHRRLDEALAWLGTIPHAVPNAFLLAAPGLAPAIVEAAPNAVVIRRGPALAHANTVTEPAILAGTGRPFPPTCPRQQRLESRLAAAADLDLPQALDLLLDIAPVPSRGICYEHTLASMVFSPDSLDLHIDFGPFPKGHHLTVSLRD